MLVAPRRKNQPCANCYVNQRAHEPFEYEMPEAAERLMSFFIETSYVLLEMVWGRNSLLRVEITREILEIIVIKIWFGIRTM